MIEKKNGSYHALFSNSIRGTDPILVLVTCVYLATKIEECPIHIKMVTQEAKHVFQRKFHLSIETTVY